MASVLSMHSQQGDPECRELVQNLLGQVCVPIFEMIYRWLSEGELVDQHQEFFVVVLASSPSSSWDPPHETTPTASSSSRIIPAEEDEKLWHSHYVLQEQMIPR